MGCCLFALASWLSPRFALFLWWIFGDKLSFVFDAFWKGFLGFLIVPWATLFYALAYAIQVLPSGVHKGVTGIGWLFVAFGLLLDITTWTGGGRSAQQQQQARREAAM
jgi:hypothetical protein